MSRAVNEVDTTTPFPLRLVRDPETAHHELQRLTSRTTSDQQGEARDRVDQILEEVQRRGDTAVRDFTERFDGFRPEPIAVPAERLEQAWGELPLDLRDALELACRRIQEFHHRCPLLV